MSLNKNLIYPIFEKALKRDISSKVTKLNNFRKLSQKEISEYQLKRLHQVLVNAENEVPYYHKLFKAIRFKPDSILKDRKYFDDIPYLTKQTILSNPNDFVSNKIDKTQYIRRKTNGSTGATLTTIYSKDSLDWTSAINRHVQETANHHLHDKECYLYTNVDLSTPSFTNNTVEQLKCLALNRIKLSLKDLNEDSLQKTYESLKKIRPNLIQVHPTILCALADFLQDKNQSGINLFRTFESTGETLSKERYQLIQKVFGCNIINRYGNAEFGVIAYSSANQPYQLKTVDYSVIAENFIYGNGIPEIVVTGLLNPAMPYIKYRTGDIGEVVSDPVNGNFIKNISGRVHDIFMVKGTQYSTSCIRDLFDGTGGVDDFQLVQSTNSLKLNVALNDKNKQELITQSVQRLFGDTVEVSFVSYSNFLKVGWRDKFKNYLVIN